MEKFIEEFQSIFEFEIDYKKMRKEESLIRKEAFSPKNKGKRNELLTEANEKFNEIFEKKAQYEKKYLSFKTALLQCKSAYKLVESWPILDYSSVKEMFLIINTESIVYTD